MFLFQQYAGSSNVPFRESFMYLSKTSGESLETSQKSTSDVQSKQTPKKSDDESEQQSSSKKKESTEGNNLIDMIFV